MSQNNNETKKRRKGEGMIREYQPGKWVARITINGKQKAFYGASEREARKKLDDFKKKISMGLTDFSKMTYNEFLDMWLEMKREEDLKAQSYHRLVSTIKVHIREQIGYLDIGKIDSETIKSQVFTGKLKKLSHSSIKKVHETLNASFRYAMKKGLIVKNPMDLVSLQKAEKAARKKKTMEIFTDDEIKRFVEAANAKYLKKALTCVLFLNCWDTQA
jgi:site-specific recombinase XerD